MTGENNAVMLTEIGEKRINFNFFSTDFWLEKVRRAIVLRLRGNGAVYRPANAETKLVDW